MTTTEPSAPPPEGKLVLEGRAVRFGYTIALKLDNCLFPTYYDLGDDIGQWVRDRTPAGAFATATGEESGLRVRVTVEVIDDH